MTRLKKINELKKLEITKTNFENALNDISDFYCKNVYMYINIDGTAVKEKRKYNGEGIEINKPVLEIYIKHEIEVLEKKINELIGEL